MQQGILSPREEVPHGRLLGASARSGRERARRRRPPRTVPPEGTPAPAKGAARHRGPSRAPASGGARRGVPPWETRSATKASSTDAASAISASAPSPHPAQRTLAGPRGGKAPSPSRARRNGPAGSRSPRRGDRGRRGRGGRRLRRLDALVLDLPEELEREVELKLRDPPEAVKGRKEAPRSGEPAPHDGVLHGDRDERANHPPRIVPSATIPPRSPMRTRSLLAFGAAATAALLLSASSPAPSAPAAFDAPRRLHAADDEASTSSTPAVRASRSSPSTGS